MDKWTIGVAAMFDLRPAVIVEASLDRCPRNTGSTDFADRTNPRAIHRKPVMGRAYPVEREYGKYKPSERWEFDGEAAARGAAAKQ